MLARTARPPRVPRGCSQCRRPSRAFPSPSCPPSSRRCSGRAGSGSRRSSARRPCGRGARVRPRHRGLNLRYLKYQQRSRKDRRRHCAPSRRCRSQTRSWSRTRARPRPRMVVWVSSSGTLCCGGGVRVARSRADSNVTTTHSPTQRSSRGPSARNIAPHSRNTVFTMLWPAPYTSEATSSIV
jgi:hypothetical protein